MKLLYLSKEIFSNKHRSLFKSLGIETVHYKNPLKAIDNLHEIEPNILYLCKDDFPRLWKIVLSGVRDIFSNEETIFILEGKLNEDETKAFDFLKGSLLISELEPKAIKEAILGKFPVSSNTDSYYPTSGEIGLGFINPDDYAFINGQISLLTNSELNFTPENIEDLNNLAVGTIIKEASLSYGDLVVTLQIEIKNINSEIIFLLKDNSDEYQKLVSKLFV
ncbi:MAG: hypothetical protein OCD02_23815 [Spirochaetaceae bacterium]